MAQIRLQRHVRNHGSFKAWLCTHLCNNCCRVLLILQLSLCWFITMIWKKLEQKGAFNSSLNLYSKAMYSGLPRWLLSPSLPMPLGKTLKGSTASLPGSPPAFLNRCLLQPGGHLQPVQVYRYCPHLLRTLPAARHRQRVGRGPASSQPAGTAVSTSDQGGGAKASSAVSPAGIWPCCWVSEAASRSYSVLFTLPLSVAPDSCSFLLNTSKHSRSDLFPPCLILCTKLHFVMAFSNILTLKLVSSIFSVSQS